MGSGAYRISKAAPLVMSSLALLACLAGWTGILHDPPNDEGALAHVFQILMAGQLPFIAAFFILSAVRQHIRADVPALAAQIGLWFAAALTVPLLGL